MFTVQQIQEIARKLSQLGKADTQFPDADSFSGNETIAFVQEGENRKLSLDIFASYLQKYIHEDIQGQLEEQNSKLDKMSSSIEDVNSDIKQIKEDIQSLNTRFTQLNDAVTASLHTIVDTFNSYKASTDAQILDLQNRVHALENVPQPNKFTLTIETVPADAVVKLNGSVGRTITADSGTEVTIEVSKEGYISHSENYTITQTETKTITLQQIEDTIEVSPGYLQVESNGGISIVQVTSNASWTIE